MLGLQLIYAVNGDCQLKNDTHKSPRRASYDVYTRAHAWNDSPKSNLMLGIVLSPIYTLSKNIRGVKFSNTNIFNSNMFRMKFVSNLFNHSKIIEQIPDVHLPLYRRHMVVIESPIIGQSTVCSTVYAI